LATLGSMIAPLASCVVAGAMLACLAVRLRERRGAAAPEFLVAMMTSFSVIEARPR
jgi:hypothetical protein